MIRIFLLLMLLGLVAYNTFETAQLRAEVDALRGGKGAGQSAPISVNAVPASALESLRRHSEQADALLRKQKYSEAAREIALATQAAGKAGTEAKAGGEATIADLKTRLSALTRLAESLQQKQNQTTPKNGKVETQ